MFTAIPLRVASTTAPRPRLHPHPSDTAQTSSSKDRPPSDRSFERKQRPSSGTGINYHGGPVLQAGTNVVSIYWASAPIYIGGPAVGTTGAGASDGSLVGFFLRHLGGSPYFGINSSYTNGSGQAIVNSVSYTGFWANGTNAPSGTQNVSDAQMIAWTEGLEIAQAWTDCIPQVAQIHHPAALPARHRHLDS